MTRVASSQIVNDGFSLVNFAICMVHASKYSVASFVASFQNFLSAASLSNLGIALEAFW